MIGKMSPELKQKYEFVPQAIVKHSPAFFAARGIAFTSDVDDINTFQVAELELSQDHLPFALMRHEGTPPDETEVYLPAMIPLAEISAVIGRILSEFDLPPAAIAWQRQSIDTPY